MANIFMVKCRIQNIEKQSGGDGVSPPLGHLCLAAYARQERPGKDVFFMHDERVQEASPQDWSEIIQRFKPDLIVFSALTIEAQNLKYLSQQLRRMVPQATQVAGGPWISSVGGMALEMTALDYIIQGEGEIAFIRLLDFLDSKDLFPKEPISGLAFRNIDGVIVSNPSNLEIPSINDLPIPAWDLTDLDLYARHKRMTFINSGGRYAALFTSRGCPYKCTYCHSIFPKKFRAMKPKRVVDEIQYLITQHDVNDFEIYDDIFNFDPERISDICREIKKRGLIARFSFPNGVRGDLLNERIIRELRSAGTYYMAFAVESPTPRIQKMIRKNNRLDVIEENISIAVKEGIFTWGFFMIGFPGETRREIWNTIWFAVRSQLQGALFFVVVPHEGTELAKSCPEQTVRGEESTLVGYDSYKSDLSKVSSFELSLTQSLAFILFYFHPVRMIRIWRSYPFSKWKLIEKAVGLFSMIIVDKGLFFMRNVRNNSRAKATAP